jgi:hypothetical protein
MFRYVVSTHDCPAAGDWNEGGHHANEGAFSGAVRTKKTEYFPVSNRKADALDRFEIAVTLDDVFDRYCGFGSHAIAIDGRAQWGSRSHCFTNLALGM